MIDKQFEKQIRDKMNRMEVEPGEGLLDSIFEKRAAAKQPKASFGYLGYLAVAASIAGLALIFLWSGSGSGKEGSPVSQVSPSVQSQASEAQGQHSGPVSGSSENLMTESGSVPAQTGSVQSSSQSGSNRQGAVNPSSSSIASHQGSEAFRNNREVNNDRASYTGNSQQRTNALKKPSYNANPDFASYFNVDAKNRPVIASESHEGNSHLFVYQNVDPSLTDLIAENARPHLMRAFPYQYESDEDKMATLVPVSDKVKTGKPLFIDLYIVSGMGSFSTKGETGPLGAIKSGHSSSAFGIRVSKPVAERFSAFTGLEYGEFRNQYKGNIDVSKEITEINSRTTFINDPVKGTIAVVVKDTHTYTKVNSHKADFRNSYQLLSIPLGFSYHFGFKKIDFSLNLSANLQYMQAGRFNTWSATSESLMEQSSKSYFNMGAGLSLMGSYPLSHRFRLILEPGFRSIAVPSMKSGNTYSENIRNLSLKAGIRYTVF